MVEHTELEDSVAKKCAFTKTEKQLEAARKPYSEEIKQKMRKLKKDSSKMGKYDSIKERHAIKNSYKFKTV